MDHSSGLSLWFIQNLSRFEFKIDYLHWLQQFFPGFTDVNVRLTYKGVQLSGWGYGASEDLALKKALAEVFERIVLCEKQYSTSNGLAAHTSIEEARANAVNELRERDLFLSHFLTRTPLPKRNEKMIDEFGLTPLADWFIDKGILFSLHRLGQSGWVAALDGRGAVRPFGFAFGAAVRNCQRLAALSASIEACRDGFRLISAGTNYPSDSVSLDTFLKKSTPDFSDHGRLALDLDYAQQIQWFVDGEVDVSSCNHEIAACVTEVKMNAADFVDLPLVFARATSSRLQDIFVGSPSEKNVNFSRLSQFCGRTITWADLNHLPHPFS